MNFFILDTKHTINAMYHADQHVGKMLLEACQLLCTAFRLQGRVNVPYKATHTQHPCAVWTRKCLGNQLYLARFAVALADEWRYRFDKQHGSEPVARWALRQLEHVDTSSLMTPFAQAMPEQYRCDDAVIAYRHYYANEKRVLRGKPAQWTRRQRPEWFDELYQETTKK